MMHSVLLDANRRDAHERCRFAGLVCVGRFGNLKIASRSLKRSKAHLAPYGQRVRHMVALEERVFIENVNALNALSICLC
jgi:hypothetical protein